MKNKLVLLILIITSLLIGCEKDNPSKPDEASNNGEQNTTSTKLVDEFLDENIQNFKIDKDYSFSEEVLKAPNLKEKEIFLTGEVHGTKQNYALNMVFLKYFKKQVNIKYILSEISYSTSFYINDYLRGGDDALLDKITNTSRGIGFSEEDKMYFKKLYEYNNSLDDKDKLEIIGLDFENNPIISFKLMSDILPAAEPPKEIESIILDIIPTKEVLEKSFQSEYKAEKFSNRVLKSIDENRELYEDYFGEKFYIFELINQNIVNYNKINKVKSSKTKFNQLRDQMLYENFIKISNNLPYGKYYGQMGAGHVLQNQTNDIEWFASILNKNKEYNGKIYSIVYNYIDCEFVYGNKSPKTKTYIFSPSFMNLNQGNDEFIILDLTSDTSEDFIIPMVDVFKGSPINKGACDYMQNIIIIKKSKADSYIE